MPAILTDPEISGLLLEGKALPARWRDRFGPQPGKRSDQSQYTLEVTGDAGSTFRLVRRQDLRYPHQFSAVLLYVRPDSNVVFRLCRYNGPHRHPNRIEGTVIEGAHRHIATERYQSAGWDEDGYAEADSRYVDLGGAVDVLLSDCAFREPQDPQQVLKF